MLSPRSGSHSPDKPASLAASMHFLVAPSKPPNVPVNLSRVMKITNSLFLSNGLMAGVDEGDGDGVGVADEVGLEVAAGEKV